MTPLMNIFVTMIPLLLLTAAFTHIGMVSVSVPTQSEEVSSVATGKMSVTVNVHMSKAGFSVTASSSTLADEELEGLDALVPRSKGEYDFDKLTRVLERIKQRFEQSDTLVLIPEKSVVYHQIVRAMDSARSAERTVLGKKRKIPLFPVVVISSLVE